MPALYLSHGAPPLADDPLWPGQLAAWSAGLPRPRAILMVSAHWEEAPLALGHQRVPLVYDFWGTSRATTCSSASVSPVTQSADSTSGIARTAVAKRRWATSSWRSSVTAT